MARASSLASSAIPDSLKPGGIESENHPWKIRLVEHPKRFESSFFRAAKKTAHKILDEISDADLPYGSRPTGSEHWEMHHGGSLWVKGAGGWRMYRARVGIEWSMQFCAEPVKVDRLRQEAAELIDAFPLTLAGPRRAGIRGGRRTAAHPDQGRGRCGGVDRLAVQCVRAHDPRQPPGDSAQGAR